MGVHTMANGPTNGHKEQVMSEAAWGSATAKTTGGGGSDPNVLELKDSNRVRLLDPEGPVKWRQHFVESTNDPEQGRSLVCPKGPDGRGADPCPLDMKNSDAKGNQRFPISRRFAANVWDYESGSVKVLIGGPQIFEEFDAVAAVGLNPTESDFLIHKMGKGKSTSYKVVRGGDDPLPVQITPDMLHDRSKYDTPASIERIWEVLEEMGWDYDSLELPSFTLSEAEAFVMPYGKLKGQTIEQIVAIDQDYALYMHGVLKDGGQGDRVFVALQTVLEDRELVPALEAYEVAPPKPATASGSTAPASAPPASTEAEGSPTDGSVTLVGPDGQEITVPAVAVDALRAQGYTEPTPPEPEAPSEVTLVGPQGDEITVPPDSVAALEAAGFTVKGDTPPAAEPEPYQLPGDDDPVKVKLNAIPNPVDLPFKDAKRLVSTAQATFVDEDLAAAVAADKADDKAVADQAAADAENTEAPQEAVAPSADKLDPGLTVKNDDGTFSHPALEKKDYKTKGAVTQALNRLGQTVETPAPAAAAAPTNGGSSKEDKLSTAKDLLATMPEIQSDFKVLLKLFEDVAGKRQINEFTEPELDKLIAKLGEMQAEAAKA